MSELNRDSGARTLTSEQLDKLFQDDAMDITSDVQVLENMLKKDGLSDDQMTMGL